MRDEDQIETELQERGMNAPRLTPDDIDAAISSEQYHVFEGTAVTVCCLMLKNGFSVMGQSAPVSPDNFDPAMGRKIAWQAARDKIWSLEGYLLKQRLYEAGQ